MTAARFANSASWSGTQWNVAVERTASTVAVDRERRAEVRDDVLDPIAEASEALARRLDHRRGAIERDDPSTRQSIGQLLGDASAPAAGIEDALVAMEREAVQDGRAPAGHRIGDPVVGLARPSRATWIVRRGPSRRYGRTLGSVRRPTGLLVPQPVRRDAGADHEQPGPDEHRLVERLDRGLPGGLDLVRWWIALGGFSGGNVERTSRELPSSSGASVDRFA